MNEVLEKVKNGETKKDVEESLLGKIMSKAKTMGGDAVFKMGSKEILNGLASLFQDYSHNKLGEGIGKVIVQIGESL